MSLVELNIKQIVDAIVQIISQRQDAIYHIDAQELTKGLSPSVYGLYAQLNISLPDLPFLYQLASYQQTATPCIAVKTVFEAMSYGMSLQISVHENLLSALPIKGLQILPISWVDQHNNAIQLNTSNVIGYSNIITLSEKWLVIRKQSLVTPLAKELINERCVHLIKVE